MDYETISNLIRHNPKTGGIYLKRNYKRRKQGQRIDFIHSKIGYRVVSLFSRQLMVHRLVWLLEYGEWPSQQIDHINGVRSDNRIENLRDISRSENQRNSRLHKHNTSGVSGVTWSKARCLWVASIRLFGKNIYLLSSKDKFEAICARKSAERRYGYHVNHGRPK